MSSPVPPDAYAQRLAALRERIKPRRLFRSPWGWEVYTPGREDTVEAADLDELERKLTEPPAGDGGNAAKFPRLTPPAGP